MLLFYLPFSESCLNSQQKKKKSAELASLLLQKKRSEKKIEFNRLHMNYKSE
jgi:hypothetical protein